jgi:hypothetical protein
VLQLTAALESNGNEEAVRRHARIMLRRCMDHLMHAEVPLPGDGFAMSTVLVAVNELDEEDSRVWKKFW